MRVKIEFPSNHASSRMPVPDTQQWTEPVKCRNTAKCQIFHSRYRKLIASKHVVNKKSALSQEMKMDTLVADLVRIMRNVSPLCCSNTERTEHIQTFRKPPTILSLSTKDRTSPFLKASQKFKVIVNNDKNGEFPMYRG